MRDLDQYSAREWLTGVPAVIGFKEVRDAFLRDLYCARRPPGLERFLADHESLRGGAFAVTIAFEKAWLIRHFLSRLARHMPGVRVIVADNSRNPASAREIEAVVKEGGGAYFKLPPNPIRNINRSHGNALNWTWRHIIRPLRPRVFAFLDHDIFPLAPADVDALLGDQDFYGHVMDRGERGWAIWAGYSFYRFAALENLKLDFNPDMDRRLVAGGRNYGPLYRRYDLSRLRFATHRWMVETDPATGAKMHTERIDGWIHFGGASYNGDKMRARQYLEALIA
jgi:hypothetical protein